MAPTVCTGIIARNSAKVINRLRSARLSRTGIQRAGRYRLASGSGPNPITPSIELLLTGPLDEVLRPRSDRYLRRYRNAAGGIGGVCEAANFNGRCIAIRWLPRHNLDVSMFLPGFKRDSLVELSVTATTLLCGTVQRAPSRPRACRSNRPSWMASFDRPLIRKAIAEKLQLQAFEGRAIARSAAGRMACHIGDTSGRAAPARLTSSAASRSRSSQRACARGQRFALPCSRRLAVVMMCGTAIDRCSLANPADRVGRGGGAPRCWLGCVTLSTTQPVGSCHCFDRRL